MRKTAATTVRRTRAEPASAAVVIEEAVTVKALMVAYYFPPYSGSGAQRTLKFAKFLTGMGVDVTIVCATAEDYSCAGEPRDESLLAEVPADVKIVRVPSHRPFGIEGLFKRLSLGKLWRAMVRPDVYAWWRKHAADAAVDLHGRQKFDVLYASGPPWTGMLAAADAARRTGLPLVLDFRDPWTQLEYTTWPTRLHFLLDRRQERYVLRTARAVISNTNIWRQKLLTAHPFLDPARVTVLPNGFDEEEFGELPPARPLAAKDTMKVSFIGSFWSMGRLDELPAGSALRRLKRLVRRWNKRVWDALAYRPSGWVDVTTHSPYYLLKACREMLDRCPDLAGRVSIHLTRTAGNAYAEQLVRTLRLEGVVQLLGNLSHRQCLELMLSSQVLFLPLGDVRQPIPLGASSGKIFEYLASGVPILAVVPQGEAAELIRRLRAGVVVAGSDVAGLSGELERLARQHLGGGIEHQPDWQAIRTFGRKVLTRRLADLLNEAASGPR